MNANTINNPLDFFSMIKIWLLNKWNALITFGFSLNFFGFVVSGEIIQGVLAVLIAAATATVGVWGKIRSDKRKQAAFDADEKRKSELHELTLRQILSKLEEEKE